MNWAILVSPALSGSSFQPPSKGRTDCLESGSQDQNAATSSGKLSPATRASAVSELPQHGRSKKGNRIPASDAAGRTRLYFKTMGEPAGFCKGRTLGRNRPVERQTPARQQGASGYALTADFPVANQHR